MTQREEDQVIVKRYDLLAIIPERNEDVTIYLKGKTERRGKGICQMNTKEGQ